MQQTMELFKDPRRTFAKEETPQYKISTVGIESLTTPEILSLIIGNGTYEDVEKARAMVEGSYGLSQFKLQSESFWRNIPGVGPKTAKTIVAINEFQKRVRESKFDTQINCSRNAYDVIAPRLMDLDHEQFWIINLNRANKVMSVSQISTGGMAGTVVDAKILFRKAIENKASAIILGHNHPSGNLYPSQADIDLTKKLVKAGRTIDIPVLDHIIVGGISYYSFADEGKL